ncbi:hypothetical protein Val02_32040 [Virgisporangium aliadipatigenens]|uniref:PPM-type phosphatase domain-containing protein n=1 Tax=Virgisporangium aliadipatigenens TaxID=741659 RepID=A0A8J4DR18_9ACTN|nr:PP2C family protein-serine/threonine phosphatase [Virgisporangium aliadipatigenens]GIJ46318.1 hypothetical protein Val02_32040 [Virgisporangium aliadipatigenens]
MAHGSAAVQDLLLSAQESVPTRMPALLMEAAAALGTDALVAYLADYGQERLTPFLGDGSPPRETVPIDGTLAGRAYALGVPVEGDGGSRLWLPISDAGHRIGVLEVDAKVPPDAGVRAASAALASAVAGLLSSRWRYADAVERLRRGSAMQVATEIIWNLLPPLTFSATAVGVSGILEPCYDVGGDAFDYAIDGGKLHLAIFDGVGHGITASTLTTVALNAYRNARRCGLDLLDTVRSVDKWVNAQFPDLFVTGTLAELTLDEGLLRWVSAGHPGGLLLRNNQLVRDLPAPTALPLGLGRIDGPPEIAEEQLEPEDRVLFYTDGVIEARDIHGHFFGRDRLVDFVGRTLTDEVSPAETMRRLVKAILEHQHEQLQDDATALLLHWSGT